MILDFLTDSFYVRSKPIGRHYAGVKVAIGTFGLAKRYLDIDAEISHR